MSFPLSTQCKHWLFTPDHLKEMRDALNAKANLRLIGPPGSSADDPALTPKQQAARRKLGDNGLTLQEEAETRRAYEIMIQSICRRMPEIYPYKNTWHTSLMYYKRFYLTHSATEYPHNVIMGACILLACKVEETPLALHRLCAEKEFAGKVEANDIISAEIPVLEALNFHLICYHPHRVIRGFLQELCETDEYRHDLWVLQAATAINVEIIMRSDAPFIYPPAVISLFCLRITALKDQPSFPIDNIYQAHFRDKFQSLMTAFKDLDEYMVQAMLPTKPELLKSGLNKIRLGLPKASMGTKRKAASSARAAKLSGKLADAQKSQQEAAHTLLSGNGLSNGNQGNEEFSLPRPTKRRRLEPMPPGTTTTTTTSTTTSHSNNTQQQ